MASRNPPIADEGTLPSPSPKPSLLDTSRRVHSCGNCIMWSLPPGREVGVCEIGDMQPLQGVDGNGVMKDDNAFWTTADTYCDHQVPIPPPGPPCPKCGEPTVEGFGIACGGYGAYEYCVTGGCGYFLKHEEWPEDME